LNEKALITDENVERVERLHFVQVGRLDLRLAQRRRSEIDERMGQSSTAESASDFDGSEVTVLHRLFLDSSRRAACDTTRPIADRLLAGADRAAFRQWL
jgi:hypothetical protein